MYRIPASIPADTDDSRTLWDETKAELRRKCLDDRLRSLSDLLSLGEAKPKDAPRGVFWAKWDLLFDPICRVVGAVCIYGWFWSHMTWGRSLAIAILAFSISVFFACGSVIRTVIEIRRYGERKNRLPIVSLAMLLAAPFAWQNALGWSDLHAQASLLGEGSSSRQVLAFVVWAVLAHVAARRREWSTDRGPGSQHEINPTEALTP